MAALIPKHGYSVDESPVAEKESEPVLRCRGCGNKLNTLHKALCPVTVGEPYHTAVVVADTGMAPEEPVVTVSGGIKDDNLKLEYHLLPRRALEEIIGVLMYGAEKYEPNNWRKIPNWRVRYWDALMRHMWNSIWEDKDPETGFSHYAHAACCILFLLDLHVGEDSKFDYTTLRSAVAKAQDIKVNRGK